ncbi:MAG TPA: beta-N-acetylhexosaminidase [Anaerolineales bacterium]|nr:beta-N-acetylhexosaminidase [Anaerolineales bacterium]
MQNLIPLPASIKPTQETYTLPSNAAVFVQPDWEEIRLVGAFLADCLRPATGFELPVIPAEVASTGGILLTTDGAGADLGPEGYELVVEPNGILLRAPHPAGLFRGVQTLRQLLPPAIEAYTLQPGPWQMNCVTIQDSPRFGWRGVMLDVARHFFPVTAVKRLIDQMAYYKFNILHIHLTDDQGWRLMIHSWPRLAEHGGSTDFTGGPGGFYTQEEYRQIVDYAAAHYIDVIPEVDMPAHVNSALASYAVLNDSGVARPLHTRYEAGSSSLSIHKEVTYQFLEDTLREIAALTPAPYIHIGGDEAHSTDEAAYKVFIERVQKIVQGLGKQCIGWEEVSRADLLPDTIVQHWWQAPLAQEAARRGHKLILSPASRVYLDIKYDASTALGLDWTKQYIDVRDTYDWDPAHLLEGVTEESVLGVEAELWTETIVTEDDMDYMLFPRLPGCAEIGWTPQENRHWEEYCQRLANHGQRLDAMGIKFYRSPQVAWE